MGTVRQKKRFSYTYIKQTKGINLPTNLTAKLLISRHCSKCYVKVIKSEQCSTTSQFDPRSPVARCKFRGKTQNHCRRRRPVGARSPQSSLTGASSSCSTPYRRQNSTSGRWILGDWCPLEDPCRSCLRLPTGDDWPVPWNPAKQ